MKRLVITFVSMLAASVCAHGQGPTQGELDAAEKNGSDWLYVDHDYAGGRFSPLTEINSKNVRNLRQICTFAFPENAPAQTAPVVYKGVLFASSAHYTAAIDGTTCKPIWQHFRKPNLREVFKTQRGIALKDGIVVRGSPDGALYALDATTGDQLWNQQIADPADGYFVSAPPLVVRDLVFIGPAGSESAAKGWVGAFRLSNGERVWKFNTVPELGQKAAETWGNNPRGLRYGGGAIWTPMAYDGTKRLLYVPVGNPAPDFYDEDRPGSNLYTNSIVALEADSGTLNWFFQATPHDQRDYDLSHGSPIFTTLIDGHRKNVMAITGKDGYLRLLDRDSREVIYRVPFTSHENSEGPVTEHMQRICPGILGGHEWNGSAYDPNLNALFVPATDWCASVKQVNQQPQVLDDNTHGPYYFGGELKFSDWKEASGWLTSFDASTGRVLWKYHGDKPMIGGVIATAGGLVFTGDLHGQVLALDAKSGHLLYSHPVQGPIGGGVVSYEADGKQRIAVISGYIGSYNDFSPELDAGNPTISVFAAN
jgi:alcohol dehydrogenase (cytochrome c)